MNETNERRPSRKAAWITAAVLVTVFVLYPLSIGPMYVIAVRTNTAGAMELIYAPLELLPKSCRRIGARYADWWLEITNTDPGH